MQGQQRNNQVVEVKIVTWSKDSHGLFDYESRNIQVKKEKVSQPCKIYRNQEAEIELTDLLTKQPKLSGDQVQYLTSIINGSEVMSEHSAPFFLNPDQKELMQQQQQQDALTSANGQPPATATTNGARRDTSNNNFLIVRSLKNRDGLQKGYVLEPGDIVKLGRIEYLVVEIRDDQGLTQTAKQSDLSEIGSLYEMQKEFTIQDERRQCKICLLEDFCEENFFISPCQCKGSCEYVHFQCLKQWVDSKIKRKETGNTKTYNWKKSECELCKAALPKKIKNGQSEYDLLEIERPRSPYIILESLSNEKKLSKSLFLIKSNTNDDPIKLGRGHDSEVRISDISVSRFHAYIRYINNKFIIYDNNSKFGTLIKLSKAFPITNDKVAIQVGRTVITFVLKPIGGSSSSVVQQPQPVVVQGNQAPQQLFQNGGGIVPADQASQNKLATKKPSK